MADQLRILIVEDQYLVAHDCQFHLEAAGFDCVGMACTAAQAIELAERQNPDVIMMDIRLADRADGVAAAIDIFERFGIRSIFTSGHADSAMREEASRAEPFGWLAKPYTPQALLSAVEAARAQLKISEASH